MENEKSLKPDKHWIKYQIMCKKIVFHQDQIVLEIEDVRHKISQTASIFFIF